MTRTDGEHELVLGNKQLLSGFFVVVILLGVFFTMGYFVGKNTSTAGFNSGQTASAGGTRPDAAGKALDSGNPTSSAPPPDSTSAAVDPNATAAPPASSSTPPSTSTSSPPIIAAPPVDTKRDTKNVIKSDAKSSAKTALANDAIPPATEPIVQPSSEEMYLQVSAIRRPDADNMVKVLRERGFPALLGESSKQGLFRVLVGPFKTNSDMGHAKADLKAKGFEAIVAK